MAIDNDTKIRHLESRLKETELEIYFESVKTMTKEQLETEIKKLKREKFQTELDSL